jgi:hypothetical protein
LATLGAQRYVVGVPTPRPYGGGPLAVFATREHAATFRRGCYGPYLIVFPCEYEPSTDTCFWFTNTYGHRVYATSLIPAGTVFADSVTLLPREEDSHD